MISELKKSDFYKCKGLLNEHGQLEAKAIVEGINPGRIFADDVEYPASGLIWLGNNDGFIFIGNERNERFNSNLNDFIDHVIASEAKKVGLCWFEGVGNHGKWNEILEKIFEYRQLGSWTHKVFTLDKNDYNSCKINIEEGYEVVKIREIFYDKKIKNLAFLHTKILEYWSTAESFFLNGIGYCVVYKNEITSICFSGFALNHIHCADIETVKEHQGKKLAHIAARAFAEDCLEQRFVPYWDCMESNKPSAAVAEKLGFKNVFNYVGYELKLV